jgi:hypothetical protein
MAYRDSAALHVDRELSNISTGMGDSQTDQFVGPLLFQTKRVGDKSNKYRVWNRDSWGRAMDDLRGPGGRAVELPPTTLSRDSYYTQEHAIAGVVPIEDDANADPIGGFNALADETERVTNTILVNRENAMMSKATTVANYNASYAVTLSGTSQWNDYTNATPIADAKTGFDAILAAIGRPPNGAIMGRQVYRKLEDFPTILDRIKIGTQVGNKALIEQLFDWPSITIANAQILTSAYGATEAVSYEWGKDVLLYYNPPGGPNRKDPAYGYEFSRPVAGANGDLMPTEKWYEIQRKSNVVRVSREYALKFITVDGSGLSNGAGYLIKNAVA